MEVNDTEEDFASLRESFTALRSSIQQELLRSEATCAGGASMCTSSAAAFAPAPPVCSGAGPPMETEEVVGGQFYSLRDQLLGSAGFSACSKMPLSANATLLSARPPSPGQLPRGMGAFVRASPANLDMPAEGLAPPPPPAEIEPTAMPDTVVLNAPKPGRMGGPSLLTASDLMPGTAVSAAARSHGAKQYMRTDGASCARADQTASLRAETPRSRSSAPPSGGLNYVSDGVIFGHLAMRAALESHRRHYAEARAALRPDGANKLQQTLPTQTSSVGSLARKPTVPKGPTLASASRARVGGAACSGAEVPAGCEYNAATTDAPPPTTGKSVTLQRAASFGTKAARRPLSAAAKKKHVPLIHSCTPLSAR